MDLDLIPAEQRAATLKELAERGLAAKALPDHQLDSLTTRTSSGVAASTPTPIHDKLDAKVTT